MTTASVAAGDRSFFGEPIGLGFLSFTEAWERFSYYGMTALLVLYMSQQLLLTGHVENIVGFAGFRAGERVGPVTFWGIEAGISAIGGVLALMLGPALRRVLAVKPA